MIIVAIIGIGFQSWVTYQLLNHFFDTLNHFKANRKLYPQALLAFTATIIAVACIIWEGNVVLSQL